MKRIILPILVASTFLFGQSAKVYWVDVHNGNDSNSYLNRFHITPVLNSDSVSNINSSNGSSSRSSSSSKAIEELVAVAVAVETLLCMHAVMLVLADILKTQ